MAGMPIALDTEVVKTMLLPRGISGASFWAVKYGPLALTAITSS